MSSRRTWLPTVAAVLAALLLPATAAPAAAGAPHWVGSWESAQILVDPADALPAAALDDVTLRQLVRTSIGGTRLRVRVSNAFGTAPLTVTGVDVARAIVPNASRIDPGSNRMVTFGGSPSVVVPAGADYLSDPVDMPVEPLSTLAVSMHLRALPKLQTGHPGSRATSYVVAGDQLAAAELANATTLDRWYFLDGIDVDQPRGSAAIVALGDSITDGHGVDTNSNGRWTDILADRLTAAKRGVGVLNAGIGGNRLLNDGIGPNAVARLDRDVLSRCGVRYLIILEGVNDLGVLTRDAPVSAAEHQAFVQQLLTGYAEIVERARERGIKVIGATIMPYAASGYYHPGPPTEADRQVVNAWIRKRGNVDAVIDFDALMRDPAHPDRLRKDDDSGDGLHPSMAGYRAMGEAIPLSLFTGGRH
jgi:lysophospholipase L1-like esterase